MTETRRRKIFPHLDDQNKKSSSNDDNKFATAAAAANKAADDNDEAYDNAKSKTSKTGSQTKSKIGAKNTERHKSKNPKQPQLPHQDTPHLLPLPLILTTLLCSGLFWITSFRDVMATGKPILDTLSPLLYPHQPHSDLNLLEYTKSTQWFDDSRGWKSKQGGLSTILTVTTDENNMGGLFLRKIGGVAGLAYHTSKLWPVVFSSPPRLETQGKGKGLWAGASWGAGHFDPVLAVGMVGDVCVALFYLGRMEEMGNAGAGGLGRVLVIVSLVEALVFGLFLVGRRMDRKNFGSVTKIEKTENSVVAGNDPLDNPRSLPSRIVGRTVLIVSSLIALVSVRDLFFPGTILSFLPRDDIYLEWTGAFLHSPPPDSVEADEQGLEAPLYAGDKFVSQLMGLYLCLGCLFKFVSSFGWSKGNRYMGIIAGKRVENVERSGVVSSRLIWKTQAFGDMMLLGMLRLFTPAAKTASLDLRWHLMLVAYEMFILALYGFW